MSVYIPDDELYRQKLEELRLEHRDLDEVIERMMASGSIDEFQVRRLKKRKLLLKDQISRMASNLIPDLNA